MIEHGQFNKIIKTGLYFTILSGGSDQVFTGDLFYDLKNREFQVRGIPAIGPYKRHVFDHDFKGPVSLDIAIVHVLEEVPRITDSYIDLRFLKAKSSGQFAAFLEETPGCDICMGAVDGNWDVVGDLTWFKS